MDVSRRAYLAAVPTSAVAAGLTPAPATGDDEAWDPLGRLRLTGAAEAVVDDDTAYVATVDGFAVVDLSDPTRPELVAERRGLSVANGELLEGDGGGDPDDPGGNADDPDDPDGSDDADPRPLTEILDLSVEGDRLVVPGPANPSEDAFAGFALYDTSEPADPDPLAVYETDFHVHNSELHEGYCYLVGNDGERNPLVVVDVRDDDPREVARWSVLEEEPRWAEVDPFVWYLHDVTVSEGVAVLAYWNAGTYLLDVGDPTDPSYLGHVEETDVSDQVELPAVDASDAQSTLPGNDHHSRLTGDLLAVGREAWAAEEGDPEGSGGIDLYDASEPEAIERLATLEAPETEDASYAGGEWTTAHNFSFQDDRLYAAWYRGGVSVHDVSDPADPVELARFEDREEAAFWSAHAVGELVVAPSTPLVPNAPTEGALYTFPASVGGREGAEEGGSEPADDADDADDANGANGADADRADDDGSGSDDAGPDGAGNGTDEEGDRTEPDDTSESAGESADGRPSAPGIETVAVGAAGAVVAAGAAALAWLRLRGSPRASAGDADEGGDRR